MTVRQVSITVDSGIVDAMSATGNRSLAFENAARFWLMSQEAACLREQGVLDPDPEWERLSIGFGGRAGDHAR